MKQLRIFLIVILLSLLIGCTDALDDTSENLEDASVIIQSPDENQSELEVHFIDVGQADASLLICDGHAMLIDGGNAEDSNLIYSYLKSHNITKLDYLVCTHAHEDHVGGLSGALNFATVGTTYAPVENYDSKAFKNFVTYLDKQNLSITIPSHGDTFTLGSASCKIIGPIYASDEPNNTSLVIRVVYGETNFLFTGDAERVVEQDILNAGYDVSSTVLKVGHHGSDSSTSYLWLREVAPTYAVISVGKDNSYGHPTEDVLSRLRDADVITYRTDMQGDIICVSDGKNISFSVERNANADTLSGAGAGSNQAVISSDSSDKDIIGTTSLYICNLNSMKFHYTDCSSVSSISEKNKKEVTSNRDELIEQGFSPCGNCHP